MCKLILRLNAQFLDQIWNLFFIILKKQPLNSRPWSWPKTSTPPPGSRLYLLGSISTSVVPLGGQNISDCFWNFLAVYRVIHLPEGSSTVIVLSVGHYFRPRGRPLLNPFFLLCVRPGRNYLLRKNVKRKQAFNSGWLSVRFWMTCHAAARSPVAGGPNLESKVS